MVIIPGLSKQVRPCIGSPWEAWLTPLGKNVSVVLRWPCDPLTFKMDRVSHVAHSMSPAFFLMAFSPHCPEACCLCWTLHEALREVLPEGGRPAERWCSSPAPGGDGRWAWLPLWPCVSPPTAVAHWLLPAPEIPLSPGNAGTANTCSSQWGNETSRTQNTVTSFNRDLKFHFLQRFQSFQHVD